MMNARALPIIEFTLDVPPRKIEVKQRSLGFPVTGIPSPQQNRRKGVAR